MFGKLDAVLKVAGLLEKLLNDSGLKEKFEKEGKVSGRLLIEEYDLSFELRRRAP
jgi:hypothetical protein